MAKRDYTEELLQNIQRERALAAEKKNRRKNSIFISLVIYMIIISGIGLSTVGDMGFLTSFRVNNQADIVEIKNDIEKLQLEISKVSTTAVATTSPEINSFLTEIDALKRENQAIYETISVDPHKAVTAVLLRNQMDNLEERFKELQDGVTRTNSLLVQLFWVALLLPIIGLAWRYVENRFFARNSNE